MALIRSLDPERFNAETLAQFYWDAAGEAPFYSVNEPTQQIEIDFMQRVLDAMVAEGILSTKEPLESGESPNIAEAIREWHKNNVT